MRHTTNPYVDNNLSEHLRGNTGYLTFRAADLSGAQSLGGRPSLGDQVLEVGEEEHYCVAVYADLLT